MNNRVIPEENEKTVSATQENATFLVIGDKAYTSEIIEEYNRNAEVKTEEFNTNATNKTNDFNTNYDNKIAAFNSNANTQKEEFDSHVLMQTNTFNKNAASTIANYNSNAEQKTNEFNQNALSYQEGIDANKKHIINVSNELERVKTDILETGEDTDTFLHLEDSAMAEYQELSVDGVCMQETTQGYNIFNPNYVKSNYTSVGVTIIKNDDVINVSGTNSSSSAVGYSILTEGSYYSLKAGVKYSAKFFTGQSASVNTYRLDIRPFGSLSTILTYENGTDGLTYTPTEDIDIIFCIRIPGNGTVNLSGKILLCEGDLKDYEPYTGEQPSPNPDYPQEIKTIENSLKIASCNKNLFDDNIVSNIWSEYPYGNIVNMHNSNLHRYNCAEGETYILSAEFEKAQSDGIGLIMFTDEKGNNLGRYVTANQSKIVIKKVAPKGTKYIYAGRHTIKPLWIQLEKDSIITDFEQHLETQITVNLPEGEFIGKVDDTNKDTLKVEYNEEDGQYHLNLYKNIGKVVLDGSDDENWLIYGTGTPNFFYYIEIVKAINNVCKSNYFPKYGIGGTNTEIGINITANIIRLRNEEEYTIENFKNWLNSHHTEVYYALETPYKLDLGIVDMPITYNEITNLFTDSDLMPQINAKYYRTFEKTIQNLQVNEKALKQELIDINARLSALENAQTSAIQESEVVE